MAIGSEVSFGVVVMLVIGTRSAYGYHMSQCMCCKPAVAAKADIFFSDRNAASRILHSHACCEQRYSLSLVYTAFDPNFDGQFFMTMNEAS